MSVLGKRDRDGNSVGVSADSLAVYDVWKTILYFVLEPMNVPHMIYRLADESYGYTFDKPATIRHGAKVSYLALEQRHKRDIVEPVADKIKRRLRTGLFLSRVCKVFRRAVLDILSNGFEKTVPTGLCRLALSQNQIIDLTRRETMKVLYAERAFELQYLIRAGRPVTESGERTPGEIANLKTLEPWPKSLSPTGAWTSRFYEKLLGTLFAGTDVTPAQLFFTDMTAGRMRFEAILEQAIPLERYATKGANSVTVIVNGSQKWVGEQFMDYLEVCAGIRQPGAASAYYATPSGADATQVPVMLRRLQERFRRVRGQHFLSCEEFVHYFVLADPGQYHRMCTYMFASGPCSEFGNLPDSVPWLQATHGQDQKVIDAKALPKALGWDDATSVARIRNPWAPLTTDTQTKVVVIPDFHALFEPKLIHGHYSDEFRGFIYGLFQQAKRNSYLLRNNNNNNIYQKDPLGSMQRRFPLVYRLATASIFMEESVNETIAVLGWDKQTEQLEALQAELKVLFDVYWSFIDDLQAVAIRSGQWRKSYESGISSPDARWDWMEKVLHLEEIDMQNKAQAVFWKQVLARPEVKRGADAYRGRASPGWIKAPPFRVDDSEAGVFSLLMHGFERWRVFGPGVTRENCFFGRVLSPALFEQHAWNPVAWLSPSELVARKDLAPGAELYFKLALKVLRHQLTYESVERSAELRHGIDLLVAQILSAL